jgi:hypothetical protein
MFTAQIWRRRLGVATWLVATFAFGVEAREAAAPSWDKVAGGREPGAPVLALIGLQQQKITVYDSEGPILQAPISSGAQGYETPAGVFTILQKNRDHTSNLYDDAEMPFMQRITWTGVALHAGALPGYRASHGCIRLPYTFAERLFDLTNVGTRVIIAPNKVDAIRLSHPLLDSLQRAGASATSAESIEVARRNAAEAKSEAEAAAQRAEAATDAARRAEIAKNRAVELLQGAEAEFKKPGPAMARAQAQLEKRQADAASKMAAFTAAIDLAQATDAERIAAEQRARDARYRTWPLSILVSRQTRRIYVRQGFEPVLEMPVEIRDSETPIGTHAFYAIEPGEGQRGWMR